MYHHVHAFKVHTHIHRYTGKVNGGANEIMFSHTFFFVLTNGMLKYTNIVPTFVFYCSR